MAACRLHNRVQAYKEVLASFSQLALVFYMTENAGSKTIDLIDLAKEEP